MTDTAWRTLSDPGLGLELAYPTVGGSGHPVVVRSEPTERGRRIHLTTADGAVYVELVRFRGLTAAEEYDGHRQALEARFGAGAVSDLAEADLNGMTALGYGFAGDGIERTVLLLPVAGDTCRIVVDPRSTLTARILATVRRIDPIAADSGSAER
jgi:hypothetical protein